MGVNQQRRSDYGNSLVSLQRALTIKEAAYESGHPSALGATTSGDGLFEKEVVVVSALAHHNKENRLRYSKTTASGELGL
ncbi:MAG: hypothetical protein GY926_21050 [bacterium]|nr:hypothetical protein [bacterium]